MMAANKDLTAQQRADIITAYRAGVPVADIADQHGIDVSMVGYIRAVMGEPPRPRSLRKPRPRIDYDAFVAQVEDELDAGITPAAIAADAGIKPQSVEARLRRAGRPDLARIFDDRAAKDAYYQRNRGTCDTCGGPTAQRQIEQCQGCARAVARAPRETTCRVRSCTRTAHTDRNGYCRTCWDDRSHDQESPRSIAGWKRINDRGIVRWIRPDEVAS